MPSVEACLLVLVLVVVLGRVGDAPAAFGYDYEHEDDDEDELEALAAEPRKAHKMRRRSSPLTRARPSSHPPSRGLTGEPATTQDGLDESNTFIRGKEPFGYPPNSG